MKKPAIDYELGKPSLRHKYDEKRVLNICKSITLKLLKKLISRDVVSANFMPIDKVQETFHGHITQRRMWNRQKALECWVNTKRLYCVG
jgi:hypothetical protein